MIYFIIKWTLSGIVIAVISEVAKRSPAFGALIASLPLLSLLGILWLWREVWDQSLVHSIKLGGRRPANQGNPLVSQHLDR